MPVIKTDLLNDVKTASLQDLSDTGLNPYAAAMLADDYRTLVRRGGLTPVIKFALDGVQITIEPYRPEETEALCAASGYDSMTEPSPISAQAVKGDAIPAAGKAATSAITQPAVPI